MLYSGKWTPADVTPDLVRDALARTQYPDGFLAACLSSWLEQHEELAAFRASAHRMREQVLTQRRAQPRRTCSPVLEQLELEL